MTLQHLDSLIGFAVVMVGVSLLILVITQMVSAVLGLRGTNLRWGLRVLVKTIDPNLEDKAKQIVEQVLHYPLISDSAFTKWHEKLEKIPHRAKWRERLTGIAAIRTIFARLTLASAIRPEEWVTVLQRISSSAKSFASDSKPEDLTTEQAMKKLLDNFDPQAGQSILALAKQAQEIAPVEADKVKRLVQQISSTAQKSIGNMEALFNSAMDRTSSRFALHTRVVTIIFSILVAFALHLDSFRLLTQLSTDAEFRGSLVAHADTMTKQADQVLTATPISPNATPEEIKSAMGQFKDQAQAIKDELIQSRFQLVPFPYHDPWYDFWPTLQTPFVAATPEQQAKYVASVKALNWVQLFPLFHLWRNLHFWGILSSAALLSLGAPFWFNTLKALTSLRPLLAGKQEKEQQTAAA